MMASIMDKKAPEKQASVHAVEERVQVKRFNARSPRKGNEVTHSTKLSKDEKDQTNNGKELSH